MRYPFLSFLVVLNFIRQVGVEFQIYIKYEINRKCVSNMFSPISSDALKKFPLQNKLGKLYHNGHKYK